MEPTYSVYVGLGSNLDDPVWHILSARTECAALAGVNETAFSSLYRSAPMGPKDQPDYVNAVMALTTSRPPLAFLHELQAIEERHGRIRTGQRWGARTLDLDLLLYGDISMGTVELSLPHPGLSLRAFVLYPLYEIAPDLVVPNLGRIADLIAACPRDNLKKIL